MTSDLTPEEVKKAWSTPDYSECPLPQSISPYGESVVVSTLKAFHALRRADARIMKAIKEGEGE